MKKLFLLATLTLASGCATYSNIQSVTPAGAVTIGKYAAHETPRTERIRDTSFGNYPFKAIGTNNQTLYGVLPLDLRVGRVVCDALFFAPGLFFNIRTAMPEYQFDPDNGIVRYRKEEGGAWLVYRPTTQEQDRARQHFEQH